MVEASFCIREDSAKFTLKGHSDFEDVGKDIICAAVSSAAIMAVNTVTEILGEKDTSKVKDGYLQFKVSGNKAARDIISGLMLHLQGLAQQYPENVRVTTEV